MEDLTNIKIISSSLKATQFIQHKFTEYLMNEQKKVEKIIIIFSELTHLNIKNK